MGIYEKILTKFLLECELIFLYDFNGIFRITQFSFHIVVTYFVLLKIWYPIESKKSTKSGAVKNDYLIFSQPLCYSKSYFPPCLLTLKLPYVLFALRRHIHGAFQRMSGPWLKVIILTINYVPIGQSISI